MRVNLKNAFCPLGAIIISVLLCGCELEPASESPSISPESARVTREGDSITFTALEGYEYSWNLENEAWGTLSAKSGKTTTYTSMYVPTSNSVVQVVTLTSRISSSSTTNSVHTKTAEAYVTHVAEDEESSNELRVSPSEVTISENEEITFVASGGDQTYDWSLSEESWGILSTREGPATTYTSIHSTTGDVDVQELTVESGDESVVVVIKHREEETEDVSVSPSEVTLSVNGSSVFTASGGNGEYAWSLQQESWGSLSARDGETVTYTSLYSSTNGVSVQELTVTSGTSTDTAFIKQQ